MCHKLIYSTAFLVLLICGLSSADKSIYSTSLERLIELENLVNSLVRLHRDFQEELKEKLAVEIGQTAQQTALQKRRSRIGGNIVMGK
ncbi:unnamed protein product [Auanema sp. JU1783]|nr:unnamed protein product [Auanema sp. JU1783]